MKKLQDHMEDNLHKLEKELEKAQKSRKTSSREKLKPKTPMGKLLNVGVELIAGVLVGVFFGIMVDWYFDTSPWGLIILFVLGSVAGMLNVYRALIGSQDKEDTGSQDD